MNAREQRKRYKEYMRAIADTNRHYDKIAGKYRMSTGAMQVAIQHERMDHLTRITELYYERIN